MKALTEAALAAVLFASIPALAEEGFSQPPMTMAQAAAVAAPVAVEAPAPAEDVRIDHPRVRFGIGWYAGLETSASPTGGGAIGLSGQLGMQINDDLAVYVMAQGSTAVMSTIGNASLIVEKQFLGHLSVGTGLGISTLQIAEIPDLFGGGSGTPGSEQISAVIPVRVAANIGFQDPHNASQSRFYIALDGAAGVVVANTGPNAARTGTATYAGGLSIGYTLM